jgi:hypothetical protein
MGGTWVIAPENKHSGATALTDSYGVAYRHESSGIAEIRGVFDLTGKVEPTLFFWDVFNLAYDDYALVEVNSSSDGGVTWTGWDSVYQQRYTTTTSWDRRQVDLKPYIGKLIKIRFRLYAEKDSRTADGWKIDDVLVIDRNGIEPVFNLPFNETAETVNDNWVYDGTWARRPLFRTVGSGNGLGPGGWNGEYFYDANNNTLFDAGELRGTRLDSDLTDLNWGTGRPAGVNLPSDDHFQIRWTRIINVASDNTQYQIMAASDDGVRVKVDGTTVINKWLDRGFPSTPDTADVTLNAGAHTIVVEYYERTSSARVAISFGLTGMVFDDSPSGNYYHQNDMSLTLAGTVNLSGSLNPALSYWERRALGPSDVAYTEISTNEGFTWAVIQTKTGTDSTWKKVLIDLSAYKATPIKIRFRLDARTDSRTGDGWYIDDIQMAD